MRLRYVSPHVHFFVIYGRSLWRAGGSLPMAPGAGPSQD